MAASTGPSSNTYRIPEVELADTFNSWRDIANTQTYKLNIMKVYDGVSSSSISMSVAGGGTLQAEIADNVGKGVTFQQPVRFMSGVTFDGDVTFNAQRFTVNANVVTIDDYAVVLGDTAGVSDSDISLQGGGGLFLRRGSSGTTAEWIWTPTSVVGVTGVWRANSHIGLCGTNSGIVSPQNQPLSVYGQGIRITGTSADDHGLNISFAGNGTTSGRTTVFSRYSPSGSTAFAEVLSGTTYGSRPFFTIRDGVNRKTISSSPGSLVFGTPVRLNSAGSYVAAIATDGINAEVVGIVSEVSNTSYEITFIGEIFGNFSSVIEGGGNLRVGEVYYLSPFTAGKITSTQPIAAGTVHKAVLIATGTNSAVVMPFTGGVLSTPIQLANATSVTTTINQVNRFRIGDIVRFRAAPIGSSGLTLSYSIGTGKTLEAFYQHGAFVKAQANNEESSEIAGMVLAVGGNTGDAGSEAYQSFDVIVDGFFNLPTSYSYPSLTPGTVYFLNTNCAGTSNGFESPTSPFNISPPTVEGTVRKPLFMATSPISGYLFSYRGDVRGPVVGITMADMEKFLVRDIKSDVVGDLQINTYNGTVAGRNSITISAGPTNFSGTVGSSAGNVGINGLGSWQSWSGTGVGSRILLPLDVQGTVRVGEQTGKSTWNGRDLLVSRVDGDPASGRTAETLNVIGTNYSNSTSGPSLVIGRGIRPNRTTTGYRSSIAGTYARSALELGVRGNENLLSWQVSDPSSVSLDGSVALTEVFSILGRTASFSGGVGIGTSSPTAMLDVNGLVRSNVLVSQITDNKHLVTREYIEQRLTEFSYIFTSGSSYSTSEFSNQVGSFNDAKNYFDVFPPTGRNMTHLLHFIPSIMMIHFAGGVDRNDSMRCIWSKQGDRIRVWVQNTEQRALPAAHWFAIWKGL